MEALANKVALFVNSSDGFDDCWPIFFDLLAEHAPRIAAGCVYLNTERKDYAHSRIPSMRATQVWAAGEVRPTWSECLVRGLSTVTEPYVLYMQEDYFLDKSVRVDVLLRAVELLEKHSDIGMVNLNEHGPQFQRFLQFEGREGQEFVRIKPPVRYFVSTQAAIWRRDYLASIVRPWENGWMFEKFASMRARGEQHASLHPALMRSDPVVSYVFTGVIKGQWCIDCVPLFERHGFKVDYEQRGFYADRGRLKSRFEVLKKMLAEPAATLKSIRSTLISKPG